MSDIKFKKSRHPYDCTCFNMTKAGYTVTVLSDCITSYDKSKIPDMLHYYESKACTISQINHNP